MINTVSGTKSGARLVFCGCLFSALLFSNSCKSSGGIEILGSADETADAAKLVLEANQDLTSIKRLYKENENKREDLKKAMLADNAPAVKKISDEIVYLINDGAVLAKRAVDKLEQARDMEINDDYEKYLRLKTDALKKQLEAFENYRQAAIALRNNYDPKNAQLKEKVNIEFKERSEKYQKITEKARENSAEANELAKEVLQRQQNQER